MNKQVLKSALLALVIAGLSFSLAPSLALANPDPCELAGIVKFANNSATLSAEDKVVLDAMTACLTAHPDARLKVEGYSNTVGSAAHNLALSQLRAESAKAYLVSKGINSARLFAVGYGEGHLLVLDYNKDGTPNLKAQAANRRCEVKAIP